MAWDTDETKRRLLEAAVIEFAEHGPAGASMGRIAERAALNKERLYNYFGDKETLFDTVLSSEMSKLVEAVDWPGQNLQDIGEYAGQLFDYHSKHPQLVRLLLMEGLAGRISNAANRGAAYRAKVEVFEQAQRDGYLSDEIPADHLVFLLIALTAWWSSVPQLASLLSGKTARSRGERVRRRKSVALAARQLALQADRAAP